MSCKTEFTLPKIISHIWQARKEQQKFLHEKVLNFTNRKSFIPAKLSLAKPQNFLLQTISSFKVYELFKFYV